MNFKLKLILTLVFAFAMKATAAAQSSNYVNVMDYISDATKDAAAEIQACIDSNPNKVIFFPDGTYTISSPILTPADPKKSVSLELSNYAVIQPTPDWKHEEAMIRLGGKDPFNTIIVPGSNYYLSGGIIDCKGVAKGVSIESGRETQVRYTSIKNAAVGLHIKKGTNSGSSDADIFGINITCNMDKSSIGILVEGFDNTFTNIRIYRAQVGVKLCTQANMLRNVHVLYGSSDDSIYQDGYGFEDEIGTNWYDFCYSDQYATAFYIKSGCSTYHDCFAYWYSSRGTKHTAFKSDGDFNCFVTNFTMGVDKHNAVADNIVLDEVQSSANGQGCFQNLRINTPGFLTSKAHEKYLK